MKYRVRENLAYLYRTMKSVERFGLKFIFSVIVLAVFVRYGLMLLWDINIKLNEVWGDLLLLSIVASLISLFRALIVIGELREKIDNMAEVNQLKNSNTDVFN